MVSKTRAFDKPSSAHDELSEQLIDAIESVRDGFALYDADERLIFCNNLYRNFYPSIANMLKPGARLEDLTRTAYEADAIQDCSAANIEAGIKQRLMHYRTAEGTHEQQLKDGRWLLCSNRRTPNGSIACIRSEITESKQVEEALRDAHDELELQVEERTKKLEKSERHLRAFFRNSDTDINIKDATGRYILVSRRFEQTYDLAEEEAHGKYPHEIFPKAYAEHVRSQDVAVLQECRLVQQEDVVPGSDPPITLSVTKFPITDEAGEVTGIGVIGVDITQQKLAEGELREAHDNLEEIVK